MKIAIVGYGKMGKEIEKIAQERGHVIVAHVDSEQDWITCNDAIAGADVAIEFSTAGSTPANLSKCFALRLPVVCGTTGWLSDLSTLSLQCKEAEGALFYAPNFSIGMNIFFEVNQLLAKLMSDRKEYGVFIEEIHHLQKADAPSGTAIKLANDILSSLPEKKGWALEQNASESDISIRSIRTGTVPGTHSIVFDSEFDTIEIKHSAKNRKGFALGALLAAEWVVGRKGVFGMKDLLFEKKPYSEKT